MEKKLERLRKDAVLGGVAAGMGEYFNIDKTIIRILWVVSLFLPLPPSFGWTIIIYVIMWAVLPERNDYKVNNPGFSGEYDANIPPSQQYSSSAQPVTDNSNNSLKLLGGVLLAIGGYMLLDEVVYWHEFRQYLWPILLIGVGAYLLLKQRDDETLKRQEYTQSGHHGAGPMHYPSSEVHVEPTPTADTTVEVTEEPITKAPEETDGSSLNEDTPENKKNDESDDSVIRVN